MISYTVRANSLTSPGMKLNMRLLRGAGKRMLFEFATRICNAENCKRTDSLRSVRAADSIRAHLAAISHRTALRLMNSRHVTIHSI
jgi:hypothetical protein